MRSHLELKHNGDGHRRKVCYYESLNGKWETHQIDLARGSAGLPSRVNMKY